MRSRTACTVTLLAGLAEASFLKGLASGFVGLLLTTVGLDTLTGSLRFTFGRTELMTGVDVVAAMVGLFAMTEMFYRIGHPGESPIVNVERAPTKRATSTTGPRATLPRLFPSHPIPARGRTSLRANEIRRPGCSTR